MANYRELNAWKKGMQLALQVYEVTRQFPREETYALAQQLRRAATSIPSNIAEGQARYSHKEFLHFLKTARGSLAEVETQLMLAQALGYLSRESLATIMDDCAELGRIVNGLRSSLMARIAADEN